LARPPTGRCAEFQFSGRKPNGDLLYKLVAITDDYRGRKASIYRAPLQRGRLCASICLLEPPHEVDLAAVCVKQDDDTVYYDEQRWGCCWGGGGRVEVGGVPI
jgi:hypothetical protein